MTYGWSLGNFCLKIVPLNENLVQLTNANNIHDYLVGTLKNPKKVHEVNFNDVFYL